MSPAAAKKNHAKTAAPKSAETKLKSETKSAPQKTQPKEAAQRAPFTTATKITIIRLCLLPLILFFYLSGNMFPTVEFFFLWGKLIALVIYVIAALTDFVDGYIARKYNQVSDLGKLLDPIADKLLTTLGFILICTDPHVLGGSGWWAAGTGLFPVWFAATVIMVALSRDFIVSFVRQIAAEKGIVYAANWSGKIKTTVQLIAQVLVMFFAVSFAHNHTLLGGIGLAHDIFSWACVFLLVWVIILNVYSTFDYIVKYQEKLKAKSEK